MSDKMRWRYGDVNPVAAAVDSATVIEIGDLVWQDTDDAKPASSRSDGGTETANQETFADKFLGVAMQRSHSGETAPVRVATTGVFEFDCPSDTFELGNLVGADENAADNALLNQQVAKVSDSRYAIGRVAKRPSAATTSVLIDIRSTIMEGGIQCKMIRSKALVPISFAMKRVNALSAERDEAKAEILRLKTNATEQKRIITDLRKEVDDLHDSDSWQKMSKKFHESGGCPVCFATDEEGHKVGCTWGNDLTEWSADCARIGQLTKELEEAKAALKHQDEKRPDHAWRDEVAMEIYANDRHIAVGMAYALADKFIAAKQGRETEKGGE